MIRKATKQDIDAIYPLIYIIWEDMNYPLLRLLDKDTFQKTMLHILADEHAKFSYKNAWVYEKENQIIGVLYGYAGQDERQFDEHFHTFIDAHFPHLNIRQYESNRESHDNEWYLDSLVVHSNYRGQGIASAFFDVLKDIVAPYQRVGLNCEQDNLQAKKLYERLGFSTVYEIDFLGHLYYHMEKSISSL
ncbi:GNAT family N-acetyltransferase [Carnobacteriaceae bacterium zg-84]|uniref:GNAT family N-acetyltransferase n=1 Tax=Granulicatella sp. zg-84 TaxID=2678503 RepID=UPI0013BECDC9|nr:GNAT family N-acetyltransferase [Granulicatella sp. zg-84]NEW65663.1 GNAT family N-acetyltransferase [Granulicatella sp. zg-84]QMI85696.1 GNAT family N-acetyltransferase [Carnobacteriaceae bacterium zg-84]